jgi:hypothetical protein
MSDNSSKLSGTGSMLNSNQWGQHAYDNATASNWVITQPPTPSKTLEWTYQDLDTILRNMEQSPVPALIIPNSRERLEQALKEAEEIRL